ncbi:MAG: hypothetical protein AAGC55_20730, partial [Myxococcota bacterium]
MNRITHHLHDPRQHDPVNEHRSQGGDGMSVVTSVVALLAVLITAAPACATGDEPQAVAVGGESAAPPAPEPEPALAARDEARERPSGYAGAGKKADKREFDKGGMDDAFGGLAEEQNEDSPSDSGDDGEVARGVQTRSWFPETFLFEPLVITD